MMRTAGILILGADGLMVASASTRPQSKGFDWGSLNPFRGITFGGRSGGTTQPTDDNRPASVRSNNPGAILWNGNDTYWQGQRGFIQAAEKLAYFDSPVMGARAQIKLARNYQRLYGLTTLRGKPGAKVWKFSGVAEVEGEMASEAQFTAMMDLPTP